MTGSFKGQSSNDIRDHSNGFKARAPQNVRPQVFLPAAILRSPVPQSNPLLPEIIAQQPKTTQ